MISKILLLLLYFPVIFGHFPIGPRRTSAWFDGCDPDKVTQILVNGTGLLDSVMPECSYKLGSNADFVFDETVISDVDNAVERFHNASIKFFPWVGGGDTVQNIRTLFRNPNKFIDAAITELKNTVADLSIDMATMVLKSELKDVDKQKQLVSKALKEAELN